jgi:hypothetical protein
MNPPAAAGMEQGTAPAPTAARCLASVATSSQLPALAAASASTAGQGSHSAPALAAAAVCLCERDGAVGNTEPVNGWYRACRAINNQS